MRHLTAIIFALTLVSCNKDTNSYSVNGTAEGMEDNTPVIVYVYENNQAKAIDTLIITDGKFSGKFLKTEEITLNYFHIEKYNANVLFFPENDDLKVTIFKDSIPSSFVSGGAQNEAYNTFSKKLRGFNARKQSNMERFDAARNEQDNALIIQIQTENKALLAEEAAYKKQFITENNNSLFSVMLLSEMMSKKEIDPSEATKIIENLSPKMAASQIAVQLKKAIDSMKKSDVGGMAPEFSAPTPEGTMLSLNDVLGKYTIIDFWASWCRPCRSENPNVVAVYNKYHDKGLNIISVSLDKEGQKDRWTQAIKDDKMDWHHVSNLKFWQEPIAQMYSVRSIPATFLLDENGKIIDKNLRGPALEAKIASLLGH